MYEFLILVLLALALGVLRPRWSSLVAAVVVGAVVAAWSFMLEDIPGEPKGMDDVAWSAAFGGLAAIATALVRALGVLIGRKLRARRSLLL
jgi:hypothetical protein